MDKVEIPYNGIRKILNDLEDELGYDGETKSQKWLLFSGLKTVFADNDMYIYHIYSQNICPCIFFVSPPFLINSHKI